MVNPTFSHLLTSSLIQLSNLSSIEMPPINMAYSFPAAIEAIHVAILRHFNRISHLNHGNKTVHRLYGYLEIVHCVYIIRDSTELCIY